MISRTVPESQFDFVEDTFTRKSSRKSWLFARKFVSLPRIGKGSNIMKKTRIWMLVAMMAIVSMASCGMEFSSGDDKNPEEYHQQIANTRWKLSEVTNQNNEWVSPESSPGFNIPELSFGYSNSYFMRICT